MQAFCEYLGMVACVGTIVIWVWVMARCTDKGDSA